MEVVANFKFKIASESWEFTEIHNLNYHTFVEEIPQHPVSNQKALTDKFHDENVYIICVENKKLHGMIAVRDKRPFSLDHKLTNLDSYLPTAESICELRLLSISRNHRNGRIIQGLMVELGKYCEEKKYDLAIMSGTLRQQKLYKHIGFEPFGPLVGTTQARYQPMYLTRAAYSNLKDVTQIFSKKPLRKSNIQDPINLLPGPVELTNEVQLAYKAKPVSHRSDKFIVDFRNTKNSLCQIVQSHDVALLMGSGTLANDVIAAQLSLLNGKGLILVNGEFGQRLVKHAKSASLNFDIQKIDSGESFAPKDLEHALSNVKEIDWLWSVHCETSSGVINNIDLLHDLCSQKNIRLCIDCISSIGTIPINLENVYLASGVSGKALGALPGIAMVFYNHKIEPSPSKIPSYIDLGLYTENNGIPFTFSSSLLYALTAAIDSTNWYERYKEIQNQSHYIRDSIIRIGYTILSNQATVSSSVITIVLPESLSSNDFGQLIEQKGFLLSYKSSYLLQENNIQICLMRKLYQHQIDALLIILKNLYQELILFKQKHKEAVV